jgi:hypothetical protein
MDAKEKKDSPQRHRDHGARFTGQVLEVSGFSVPLLSIIRAHSYLVRRSLGSALLFCSRAGEVGSIPITVLHLRQFAFIRG